MCMWVHAMRKYYYVSLEVEPLRNKLAAAEIELDAALVLCWLAGTATAAVSGGRSARP